MGEIGGMGFTNRIIGYATKPADQFQANPLNWRKHPQKQRAAVNASLRELGWVAAVIENVRTGNLIDGHERVWQALDKNEDVPYLQVDLSEDEERLALATFDAITGMAETDAAKLDELLREVNTGEAALQEMLAELAASAGIVSGDKESANELFIPEQFAVIIECDNEAHQVSLLERLTNEGLRCRALLS